MKQEVQAICGRYRIKPEEARRFLEHQFHGRPDVLRELMERYPHEEITRLKRYKALIKDVRKRIYYHLRQYQSDRQGIPQLKARLEAHVRRGETHEIKQVVQDLLLSHISTKERLANYEEFYEHLFALTPPPEKILDVGCGLHPLSYPFDRPDISPQLYVAIDRDPNVIEVLTIFADAAEPTRLVALCKNITDLRGADSLTDGGMYDMAFMLKLVPVITRQDRDLLAHLTCLPARKLLITASTESMTRRRSIRRREERVLHEFVRLADREITGRFDVGNEFGYLCQ